MTCFFVFQMQTTQNRTPNIQSLRKIWLQYLKSLAPTKFMSEILELKVLRAPMSLDLVHVPHFSTMLSYQNLFTVFVFLAGIND